MDSIKMLTIMLAVILGIMLLLLVVLGIVFAMSKMKKTDDQENATDKNGKTNKLAKTKKFKEYRTDSIMNFMDFDTVVDNMISQKDGKRYIMAVECQGINYDLMSEAEKNSVEEGFVQFLNTLRYPIQIYTQTRSVNLDSSIQKYKEKMKSVELELERQEEQYRKMQKSVAYTQEQLDAYFFELTKQRNLCSYGKDIIASTERMSLNKNVLSQKYYVIIPYYVEELGDNSFDKEEQRSLAFSELYTRAQSVARALAVCGINAKVLDSTGLIELLYVAYNRDESEVFGVEKALEAGYDELYTTAKDVIDKQIKELDKEIEKEALELAKRKVNEARNDKQKELTEKRNKKRDLIAELAEIMIKENVDVIGKDVAQDAIKKIDTKEEVSKDGKKQTRRVRKTKTA
mgnify:CR=1 FL=1